MQADHWGAITTDDEGNTFTTDKYVSTSFKKPKFDEIRQRGENLPINKHKNVELKSSLVIQTIEVMKQTEVLQSLIDTYSNKNGSSNYLLNPCQMIPEVDFPPENAADLVSEQKFQKPIWFIPSVNTPYSRGDPQPCPEICTNICRDVLRKVMCGLLRLAGFTACSETAIMLLTDAVEEFLCSLISEYRSYYTNNSKLDNSTMMKLLPLERAHFNMTGTSLTQVHNYYKHKVITRNRVEIAEFNSVLQEYDKLMKESQSSMQKQQQNHQHSEFNGNDFLNILEMQPGDDGGNSTTGSNSMGNIVSDMLQELGGSTNSNISLSNINSNQQQIISGNAMYGLLDGQMNSSTNSNLPNSSGYQTSFET